MTRTPCPCYGCKKRTEICHSSCDKFKKWKKGDIEYQSQIRESRIDDYTLTTLRKLGRGFVKR